ncbi:MAG: hypothetical protein R3A48_06975 [Polyangiales bacterium]
MNRFAVVIAALSFAACSSPVSSGGGGGNTQDAGATGGDVVTGGGDSSTPGTDSGGTPPRTDSGTTPRDSGPTDPFNYGTCGRNVAQALCMCGAMDANCQQGALQRSMACVSCMAEFQTTCCPSEVQAVQDCFTNSGCSDQNCALQMCMTQINAATACVNMRLQREAAGGGACADAYIGCLGDLPTMQSAVCSSF